MSKVKHVRLLATMVLVLVFGAGTVLGFSLGRSSVDDRPQSSVEDQEARSEQRDDDQSDGRSSLVYQLDLSEEQISRADSVMGLIGNRFRQLDRDFDRARRQLWEERFDDVYDAARDSIWEEDFSGRRGEILREARDAIRSILTPDQVEQYDQFLEDRRSRSNRGGERRGGSGGSGDAGGRDDGSDSRPQAEDGFGGGPGMGSQQNHDANGHRHRSFYERYELL